MQPAQPDALIDIKGIGPKFVEMLHAAGITTFEQLAAYDADSLAEKLGGRVTAERIRREQWIEQARERTRQRGTSLN
jgi:predicted flap endonuclease-1-like 5' DNA nuclease